MNPTQRLLAAIAIALVLPAAASPASAAALYVPPGCQGVPPDVPDGCPGVHVGDPLAAPEGECIDLRTNLVYACWDDSPTRTAIGIGVPTAYAYADARSAMSDYDCSAQRHVEGPLQWCARIGVAVLSTHDFGIDTPRLKVRATIDDSCVLVETRIFDFIGEYAGPAVWRHTENGLSPCDTGWITATVTITDADTGYMYHSSHSKAFYGPEGLVWLGFGSPCEMPAYWIWGGSHTDCMLYRG